MSDKLLGYIATLEELVATYGKIGELRDTPHFFQQKLRDLHDQATATRATLATEIEGYKKAE